MKLGNFAVVLPALFLGACASTIDLAALDRATAPERIETAKKLDHSTAQWNWGSRTWKATGVTFNMKGEIQKHIVKSVDATTLKGVRRIAIVSSDVFVQAPNKVNANQSSLSNSLSQRFDLSGGEAYSARVYDSVAAAFRAAGFEVLPREQIQADPAYQALAFPAGSIDNKGKTWGTNWEGTLGNPSLKAIQFTHYFDLGNHVFGNLNPDQARDSLGKLALPMDELARKLGVDAVVFVEENMFMGQNWLNQMQVSLGVEINLIVPGKPAIAWGTKNPDKSVVPRTGPSHFFSNLIGHWEFKLSEVSEPAAEYTRKIADLMALRLKLDSGKE